MPRLQTGRHTPGDAGERAMKIVRDHEKGRKIEAAPPPRGEEEGSRWPAQIEANGASVQEVSEFQDLQKSRKEHDCGDRTCSLGMIQSSEWKRQVATLCHRLTGPFSVCGSSSRAKERSASIVSFNVPWPHPIFRLRISRR